MKDLIIISGAPGCGKTTVAEMLSDRLGSPLLDFFDIRSFHLNYDWSDRERIEEQMSFENLEFIIKNYKRHNFANVVVTGLRDDQVRKLNVSLRYFNTLICTLVVHDNQELARRVRLGDAQAPDLESALMWNELITSRPLYSNEIRIDNTHTSPEKTVKEVVRLIERK